MQNPEFVESKRSHVAKTSCFDTWKLFCAPPHVIEANGSAAASTTSNQTRSPTFGISNKKKDCLARRRCRCQPLCRVLLEKGWNASLCIGKMHLGVGLCERDQELPAITIILFNLAKWRLASCWTPSSSDSVSDVTAPQVSGLRNCSPTIAFSHAIQSFFCTFHLHSCCLTKEFLYLLATRRYPNKAKRHHE